MFRLLFLFLSSVFPAPVPNHGKSVSYRVNTIMQYNGAGHIDLTSEDYPGGEQKSWDYDWDQLNSSVRQNVSELNLVAVGRSNSSPTSGCYQHFIYPLPISLCLVTIFCLLEHPLTQKYRKNVAHTCH